MTHEDELAIMESNIRQMENDLDIPIWRRDRAVQMLIDRHHYRAVCAEVVRLQEAKRHFSALADAKGKENVGLRQENERLLAHCAALVEIVRASPCPYNGRATAVTVGECQQCGCSSGLMIQPLAAT